MELDDRPAQNRNSEPSHLPSEVEDYSAGLTERDRSTYSDDRRE
jgi:hypothetical protein